MQVLQFSKEFISRHQKAVYSGSMPAELAMWCTVQLERLRGSNDLTLVEFCYALESESDIKAYFEEYICASPEVSICLYVSV